MFWFLTLHIMALLVWSAALLTLPLLLAAGTDTSLDYLGTDSAAGPGTGDTLNRVLFTHLVTPAALLAIVSGTAVFLLAGTLSFWMFLKLLLAATLVGCHVLLGWLILAAESGAVSRVSLWSRLLLCVTSLLMLCIVWVVLAKPEPEVGPWAW